MTSRVILIALLARVLTAQDAVRYELSFPNAAHHEAEVRATFTALPLGTLEVVMSRSSPGRYSLHEFARNMYNVRAKDAAGRALAIARSTPYQWNVSGHNGTVIFEYTLFGDVVNGTYNAIDLTHAHLNAPATFVWARGLEQRPVQVKLEAPQGVEWTVATQLAASGDWWTAPSRDLLIDSPIEFGPHKLREWRVGDAQFRMVLHSTADEATVSEYARLCEAVTVEAQGVFGTFPRYDSGRYTMLLDYLPYASRDAMEHRNSTFISHAPPPGKSSADLIESVAHEFFHSWNVERIRPRSLEPFDLERPNMSGELWFAEGVTNYNGPLVLTRAGIMDLDRFAADLGIALNALLTSPGRELFDAVGMSQLAPFYDRAAGGEPSNEENAFLSYYYYGQALGAGIDLDIRTRFPGKSLDDWMRAMWRSHPDVDKPYTQDDLQRALAEATESETFAHEMFSRYVNGHEAMDYKTLLARAGLLLRKVTPGEVWFGAPQANASSTGLSINGGVLRGSPAYVAGIDRGDRVVSVDGKDIKEQKDWDKILKSHKPGDQTRVVVEGRGGRRNVPLVWQEAPALELVTYESAKQTVTASIREFRTAWLGSKAIHPLPKLQ